MAGGAILGCLSAEQDGYRSSDIDLFVCGITDENQANEKVVVSPQIVKILVEKHLQHSTRKHKGKGRCNQDKESYYHSLLLSLQTRTSYLEIV